MSVLSSYVDGTGVLVYFIHASGAGTINSPFIKTTDICSVGGEALALGPAAKAASLPFTIATDDPLLAIAGATTGAAVITDAPGTIQQYLRGLVKLFAAGLSVVLGAGSAIIGKVGIDQTTPGVTNGVQITNATIAVTGTFWQATQPVSGTVTANAAAAAAGGYSVYATVDGQNGGVTIKSSAGKIGGWYLFNNAASTRYVKLYNKTSPASTDTPFLRLPLPPGAGANQAFGEGIAFGTAIGIRVTTGVADNDNTAPTANDVQINILYA